MNEIIRTSSRTERMQANMMQFECAITITKAAGETRKFRAVASTATVDRASDVIDQDSWRLDRFRVNPVILIQHEHAHPVAHATYVGVENGKLMVDVLFPEPGKLKKSDEVFALVEAGIVRALSVGFVPGRSEPLDPSAGYWGGKKYFDCELLEISLVSVPANADCLIQSTTSKATDATEAKTWPAGKEGIEARRRHVETLRRKGELERMQHEQRLLEARTGGIAAPSRKRTVAEMKAEVERLRTVRKVCSGYGA